MIYQPSSELPAGATARFRINTNISEARTLFRHATGLERTRYVLGKDLRGAIKTAHIALAGLNGISSWVFIQIMFAQHYAHEFYVAQSAG